MKLRDILKDAWTPADRREPWRWCEEHIKSIPFSPMPGPFRSENSPWIREVMEAIVDPKIRLVSIIAAVQSSKTTSPELTLCYIIANLPGPCLWLDQTDEDAKDESESRPQGRQFFASTVLPKTSRPALERICRRLPTGNCVIRIQSRGILERGRRLQFQRRNHITAICRGRMYRAA